MKAITYSIGVSKRRPPDQIVGDPAEDRHAGGNGDHRARGVKKLSPGLREWRREHVVDPQPERQKADRDHRQHARRVAEHGRRENVATIDEAIPSPGMKTM
jgi:hypothetical protein